jgi:hypothetical protein
MRTVGYRVETPKNMHLFFNTMHALRAFITILLLGLMCGGLFANTTVEIHKASEPPKIDGILDDPVWQKARGYTGFISFVPEFGKPAREKTVVYAAYDANHLYFAFRCYDRTPEKIIATYQKRDASSRDDIVLVFIDSHNDGQNAYMFQSNPLGMMVDGIMDSGAYVETSQDFVWEANGKKNAEGYAVEFKIPFRSLRFTKADVVKMKLGYLRRVSRYSEQYTFPAWEYGKGSVMEHFATIQLEGIRYKRVFNVLPSAIYMDHKEIDESDRLVSIDQKKIQLGLTTKVGVTSGLTLDATVNPDFSHIESDEGQVDVNLRIDALYEEKRPFFLEGLEHFNFAGIEDSPIELIVHTRNIVDPVLGLKLSGKVGKSGVVNSLFAIDEPPGHSNRGSDYYGILRYKQLLKGDSYVGGIYTGKEFKQGFRRVSGLDARLRLSGAFFLDSFFLYSTGEGGGLPEPLEGTAFGGKLVLDSEKYYGYLGYHDLSKDFVLEPGRMLRNGIRMFSTYIERYLFLSSEVLKRITVGYTGYLARDTHYNMNEYSHGIFTRFDFASSTRLRVGYKWATEVFRGVLYKQNRFSIMGRSQVTKHVYLELTYDNGAAPHYDLFIQGDLSRFTFFADIKPTPHFASRFTVTRHVFHEKTSGEEIYDIGIYRNKTTYYFNKYLSLRGIVEYDSELKKVLGDALLEFTLIPGTVIHLGYGPTLAKEWQVGERLTRYNRFRLASSTLFFKASYLFRF